MIDHATGDISHQLQGQKGQRSRSLGRLMQWPKISHIFRMGRSTKFKLGILMEYNDPYHRRVGWRQMSRHTHNETRRPASSTCGVTSNVTSHT